MYNTDIETGRAKITEASPKSERVNSQYLEAFVYGTKPLPRNPELSNVVDFKVVEEPFDIEHPHYPDPPPAYNFNKELPPDPTWWRSLTKRRISSSICASIIIALSLVIAVAITVLLVRRHQLQYVQETPESETPSIIVTPTPNTAANKTATVTTIVVVTSSAVACPPSDENCRVRNEQRPDDGELEALKSRSMTTEPKPTSTET